MLLPGSEKKSVTIKIACFEVGVGAGICLCLVPEISKIGGSGNPDFSWRKKIPSENNFKYLFITERGQKDTSNKKEDCDNSTVISDTTVAGVRREEKLQNSEMNEESLDFGEEEERNEEERKEEEEEMRPEEHRVREGETLVSIAATYDVTPSQFAQHNKLGKSLIVSTGITVH